LRRFTRRSRQGLTLLDTDDYYGMGHNELLIRDALKGRNRDRVVILAYTLRRLGTDWVDIYRLG
jgi:aryl-alcohol dehydrogenase-like predicted oxidoreductase